MVSSNVFPIGRAHSANVAISHIFKVRAMAMKLMLNKSIFFQLLVG